MKIVLIRHGRPEFDYTIKVSIKEMELYYKKYDCSEIESLTELNKGILELVSKTKNIITSEAKRSIDSAIQLGFTNNIIEKELNEVIMPIYNINSPKLPFYLWAAILFLIWFCGINSKGESKSAARKRAERAAKRLITFAKKEGIAILVGHGVFNYLIAKVLRQNGWKGPLFPCKTYWNYGIYFFDEKDM